MKKIKVRFKANISGYKIGDVAEISEDLYRRAGNDVEPAADEPGANEPGANEAESPGKKLKVLNKAMNKKQLKVK